MKRFLLIPATPCNLAADLAHDNSPNSWAVAKLQGSIASETPSITYLPQTNEKLLIAEQSKGHAVANRLLNVGDDLKSVNAFRNLLPKQLRMNYNDTHIPIIKNDLAFKVGF